jgi:hypothetical protein
LTGTPTIINRREWNLVRGEGGVAGSHELRGKSNEAKQQQDD